MRSVIFCRHCEQRNRRSVQIYDYAKHLLGESYLRITETLSETPGMQSTCKQKWPFLIHRQPPFTLFQEHESQPNKNKKLSRSENAHFEVWLLAPPGETI